LAKPATLDREAIARRFQTNMRRLGAISHVLNSGIEELKPSMPFQSDGARADMLRMIVVFLHASVEDFIRCHLPRRKFTYSSGADIERALKRRNIDTGAFTDLLPSLGQLALRRVQIVHFADLQPTQSEEVGSWNVADYWQLIHWHLVVAAFHYRLRRATGDLSIVEKRALQNAEDAIKKNVEFAKLLLAFPNLRPEERLEGVKKLANSLQDIGRTLSLDIHMFLDSDGNPIEDVVSD
jgi:hypothetical protein